MANLCGNNSFKFIWPLLISLFSLHLVRNLAEFPKIEHFVEKNSVSVSFLAVGDWGRGGYFNQSKVAYQMGEIGKKLGIDFVISTGDNFYDTGLKSVDDPLFRKSFKNIYTAQSLLKPWYAVLGNHDYLGNVEAQLSEELTKIDSRWHCKRNFMVETGIVDIFFIDTTPFVQTYFDNPKKQTFDWKGIMPREEYLTTLTKDLDLKLSQSKAPWKIVVGHHAIRSIGYHGDTPDIVNRILPILEAHKVDMYINGHDHCLEHLSNKKGTMQFLTSGGGSKAWKNIIHYGKQNASMNFYYDGQGFTYVKIAREKANVVFYDVFGKPKHYFKIKA